VFSPGIEPITLHESWVPRFLHVFNALRTLDQ
jgi:hypothetical protein